MNFVSSFVLAEFGEELHCWAFSLFLSFSGRFLQSVTVFYPFPSILSLCSLIHAVLFMKIELDSIFPNYPLFSWVMLQLSNWDLVTTTVGLETKYLLQLLTRFVLGNMVQIGEKREKKNFFVRENWTRFNVHLDSKMHSVIGCFEAVRDDWKL